MPIRRSGHGRLTQRVSPGAPDDAEVTVNSTNYTPIGTAPPSAVGTYTGPYGLGTQEAFAGRTRHGPRAAAPASAPRSAAGRAAISESDFRASDLST